jgi:hypothetical protein
MSHRTKKDFLYTELTTKIEDYNFSIRFSSDVLYQVIKVKAKLSDAGRTRCSSSEDAQLLKKTCN